MCTVERLRDSSGALVQHRSGLEVCATHLIAHILCFSSQLFYPATDAWVRHRQLRAIVEELQMPSVEQSAVFSFPVHGPLYVSV